jgi:hypothetical protein
MSLLAPLPASATPKDAAEKMEALLLQRMLASAHLFGTSSSPGASIRADLFSEALAEAVAHSGSLGIAKTLLPPEGPAAPALKESGGRVEAGSAGPLDPRHV